MAFVEAKSTSYVNMFDAAGNPSGIAVIGYIKDDTWPQDYIGAYEIVGADFAALPAQGPLGEVPGDPRFDAVKALADKFVKAKWTELTAVYAAQPVLVAKPAEQVAMLPAISPVDFAAIPS